MLQLSDVKGWPDARTPKQFGRMYSRWRHCDRAAASRVDLRFPGNRLRRDDGVAPGSCCGGFPSSCGDSGAKPMRSEPERPRLEPQDASSLGRG